MFAENFPIADTRNNFVLEFLDYYIDPPRYTIDECLERGLTYSVPLKAKLKLYCTDPDHEDFATVIQDVYLGPIPYMTDKGTFVINGAERVVVSQLHRSPGVFFGQSTHANGTKLYSARIIPFRGSWIEFATDINNVMYAYIDRKKKLPVTTLLRAIGLESDKDIIEIFGLAEEIKVNKTNLKKAVGRKLAARVLKTGLKTSLTKIPVKLCRSSVTTSSSTARLSLKKRTSGKSSIRACRPYSSTRKTPTPPTTPSYSTHSGKIHPTPRKKLSSTSTDSSATPSRRTMQARAKSSPTFSSLKSAMTSAK